MAELSGGRTKQFPLLKILWATMLSTTIFIWVVVLQTVKTPTGAASMLMPLLAISIFLGLASVIVRKIFFMSPRLFSFLSKNSSPEEMATNAQTNQIDQIYLEQLKLMSKEDIFFRKLNIYLFMPYIISFALAEAIVIFGLVEAQMTGVQDNFYIFAAGGLVCFLLAFPRPERIFEELRAQPEYFTLASKIATGPLKK